MCESDEMQGLEISIYRSF